MSKEEREIASEPLIDICPRGGHACAGQPTVASTVQEQGTITFGRTPRDGQLHVPQICPRSTGRPRVEAVRMFLARVRDSALAYSICGIRKTPGRSSGCLLSAYLHLRLRRPIRVYDLVHAHRLECCSDDRRKRKSLGPTPGGNPAPRMTLLGRKDSAAQPDPENAYAEEETLQLIDVLLGRMRPYFVNLR
jgi:hypothetical protein